MLRAVVPGLLCLLAAPAAAQPPQPPPPVPLPAQPVPLQPPPLPSFAFPAQPTGRVPNAGGGTEPRVVVAKVVDGALVWKSTAPAPVTRQMDVTSFENGQPVTRKQTVTMMQPTGRNVSVPLEQLKVRDAAGKKLQPLSIEIQLGDGKGVVLHSEPLPDALKAMFKADTLFVELPPGAGQMMPPGVAQEFVPGGGIRIRPAPVVEGVPLPGAPPQPAPAPPR